MIEDRILVVDDEDQIRRQLVRVTQRCVRTVDDAADGMQASHLFEIYHHPLVLLDLRLPRRDGMDVLREINRIHPATKTVILTAHGTEEDAINALNLGAFRYLKKPLDVSSIERAIGEGYARYRRELECATDEIRREDDLLSREIDSLYRRLAELAPRASEDGEIRVQFEDTMRKLREKQHIEADRARRLLRASVPLDPKQAYDALRAAREELGHESTGRDSTT